jgi:hypothetical protein
VSVALAENPFVVKAKGSERLNPFIERARQADAEVEHLQEQFSIRIPDTPEGMLELLQTLDDDALKELLRNSEELEQRLAEHGPQTDDELYAWIKSEFGIDLPRKSVCPDHDPPFKFLADLYFERVGAVLAMGNRGGGKTLLVAILHWLNSIFKPGCESCTFGATEAQSLRCYAYIKGWIYVDGEKRPEIVSTLMRKTLFTNTSDVEVLPGTPDAVNGPHPQKAHADEVELMREDTWKESRNMRQPLDALIATPVGWRRMGDLKVGDYVFGLDGKQKRVLALHDISEQDIYRVELTDGRSTECCNEHLWMVCYQPKRSVRANFKVMQTQEMLKSGLKSIQGYRYGLPLVEPVQYDEQDLPVDPYVLGVLIGDGCLREQKLTFRSEDKDILREVERRLPETVRVMSDARNDGTITYRISKPTFESSRNPVMAEFDRMGLTGCGSHEKFIPDSYKRGDIRQRLDLLRGLMDTDGSFSKDPYFATVSERLAADVSEIVYSLGGRGLCRRKATSASAQKLGSCGYIYEVSVSLPDEIPFLCQRKIEKFRPRIRTLGPAIRSITFVGRKLARCISVEDEMYLTDSYIPTHNTMGKTLPDGRFLRPQDICTSTRKGPNGRMQKLIDEITAAVNAGFDPPRTLYKWCIKETAAKMTNCQVACPDLPDDQKCRCHRIRKGNWEDGTPRLLKHICNGDFYRADGWQPFENIIKQFTENDQETFETQSLCLKPEMRFHYLPKFNEAKHCFRNYDPDPRNGPIYTSVDWGGCYDEKTEVLTARGWVKWPDVKSDDYFASLNPETELVEYQQANEIIAKHYQGFLQSWNNRSVDLLVTADHNMLISDLSGDPRWRLEPSYSVPNSSRMLKTSAGRIDEEEWAPSGIDPEVWAAFLGLWMAEGHTHLGRTNNGNSRLTGIVGITIGASDLREEFELLVEPYFNFRWNPACSQYVANEPWLYEHLSQFGKAGDKYLPDYVKRWPRHLLRIYIEWHMRGDGNWSPHTTHGGTYVSQRLGRIYTGSKRLADDLQEIAMYAGLAAHIGRRDPRDSEIYGRPISAKLDQYTVGFTERRVCPQVYTKPSAEPVRKTFFPDQRVMVYCAVLPKYHTLYVRRNGKAVWCGNTNPHAVNWYQYLKFDIDVDSFVQSVPGETLRMRLPAGSIICFDEIYKAEMGNDRLGQLVKLKESIYRRQWGPMWQVTERFADPQGKAARLDWKNIGLKTSWHITREFEEHIKVITDLFDSNSFYVAGDKCLMFVREAHEWRRHETTGLQLDTFNHCMSNFRYAAANMVKLHRRDDAMKANSAPLVVPADRQAGPVISIIRNTTSDGPIGVTSHGDDQFEIWRGSLGQPVKAGAGFP